MSDEFTVLPFPLHGSGSEEVWWQVHGTDPLVEAKRLWQLSRNGINNSASAAAATNGGPPIEGEEPANATASEAGNPVAAIGNDRR
jgi:hypothetical protein